MPDKEPETEPDGEQVTPAGQLPRRAIRDAQTARALAHPVRIKLVEQLAFRGPKTATELAELVGESPANTSWHLRQLARFHFVEEAGGGTGRQRPWRLVLQSNEFAGAESDPETTAAAQITIDLWLSREFDALRAWQRSENNDPEWAAAAYLSLGLGWYTRDELHEVGRQILAILMPYFARIGDPDSRPPGARAVRTVQWGIPADTLDDPV